MGPVHATRVVDRSRDRSMMVDLVDGDRSGEIEIEIDRSIDR